MTNQPPRKMAMTDLEKIDYLGEALNNLMQSADSYIVDGSWIDELTLDIETARNLLKEISPNSWNVEAEEEREWVGTIRMREDLIEEELAVPASFTFENYDTMVHPTLVTAEELEGATQGDDPRKQDEHAFCYVQLKDGRSMYFLSVDLDFK